MYNKPEIQTQVVKPKMVTKFDDQELRILSEETESALDSAVKYIENFISFNSGKGKSDAEKDSLYASAKLLWEDYVKVFRNANFTFYLNQEQFDYFTKILRDDIEYDVNTIFFGIELTDTLGSWVQKNIEDSNETIRSYSSDPVSVNYLNHLVSTVKIKGLTEEAYLFAQVYRKLNEMMKIVNFYDNNAKSLSKDIQEWVASFEEETINSPDYQYSAI